MQPIEPPPPPPARIFLETPTAERAELYAHVPPPGRPIPVKVSHFPVDDTILGGEEIAKALMRLRLHSAGVPSGMRAKHLRLWLRVANWEENPDPGNWEKVIAIIQENFRGGELAALCAWHMVVMIPKGGSTNFRGIGLVEVL